MDISDDELYRLFSASHPNSYVRAQKFLESPPTWKAILDGLEKVKERCETCSEQIIRWNQRNNCVLEIRDLQEEQRKNFSKFWVTTKLEKQEEALHKTLREELGWTQSVDEFEKAYPDRVEYLWRMSTNLQSETVTLRIAEKHYENIYDSCIHKSVSQQYEAFQHTDMLTIPVAKTIYERNQEEGRTLSPSDFKYLAQKEGPDKEKFERVVRAFENAQKELDEKRQSLSRSKGSDLSKHPEQKQYLKHKETVEHARNKTNHLRTPHSLQVEKKEKELEKEKGKDDDRGISR